MPDNVSTLARQIMERCDTLAEYTEEHGKITRRYLTPPMHDVHRDLTKWMEHAGLKVQVDAAGNIRGRSAGSLTNQILILGSHLDTVPDAGKYDGVLGVLLGVAVCELLQLRQLPFAIEVIGFSEEEGVRYAMPYLGSRAITGDFNPEWLAKTDAAGTTLCDAIELFGLDPTQIPQAFYRPEEILGYIEAHIEQGPLLEQSALPVGVVDRIVGQSRLRLRFKGMARHAGTTPMIGRQDALVAAAALITYVRKLGLETSDLRATVGWIYAYPNAPNVIPGEVELSLDVRHGYDHVREEAVAMLLAQAEHIATQEQISIELIEHLRHDAAIMDTKLVASLEQSVATIDYEVMKVSSGAGHDAVAMAERFPTAMLFIRHPGGVSHHPDETVDESDVAFALEVLIQFVDRLAQEYHKL